MPGIWKTVLTAVLSCVTYDVSADGVCETLAIPMKTVDLAGGMGQVCVVNNCLEEDITLTVGGQEKCFPCSQEKYTPQGSKNERPLTNFCPVGLALCDATGTCVPDTSQTYYKDNYGLDWQGVATQATVTATQYGGSTACGCWTDQGVCNDVNYLVDNCMWKVGLDGVGAVPVQMYGSDSTGGQGCYKNNNLCYKLTGPEGHSASIAIFDICGGYVQATADTQPPAADFAPYPKIDDSTVCADMNQVIHAEGGKIFAGCPPSCDAAPAASKDYCMQGGETTQVDWCGSQDHAHFDLATSVFEKLCAQGVAVGHCMLHDIQPFACSPYAKQPYCCMVGTCDSCDTLTEDTYCNAYADGCSSCGGADYCTPDPWYDLCEADAGDIPGGPGTTPGPASSVSTVSGASTASQASPSSTPTPPPC